MVYFPNDKAFLTQSFQRIYFRFALRLFCCLIILKTQNSYFAIKVTFFFFC